MTTIGKSLGYAYIATRKCGRVSGLAWEDVTSEKDAAMLVREWTQRGDDVQLIERFEGDPMPEWVCRGEPCYCEAHRAGVKTHGICDRWNWAEMPRGPR